jgi:hypothetical protein
MFECGSRLRQKPKLSGKRCTSALPCLGVMLHRQGPKGEVTRLASGQAQWSVEHPHPWRAQVGDFQSFGENPTDVVQVDGIAVWLALTPRLGELGVEVPVQNGALHVEPLAA